MTIQRLHSVSRVKALLMAFATLTLGGCDAKTASFFEALAGPPVGSVFDCALLHNIQASILYEWVSSSLPGETPPPPDFAVPGTFTYSGNTLSLQFADAPVPITGICLDGVWGPPAGTGPVMLEPGVDANEQYTNATFTMQDNVIGFRADSRVEITVNGSLFGERDFDVSGSYTIPMP